MFLASTKIIGTAATGLWAAYNISICHNYAEVPGVALILGQQYTDLKSVIAHSSSLSVLSAVSSASLLLSYLASPRHGKHPYLLYVALGAPLIGLLQYSGAQDLAAQLPSEEASDLTGSAYGSIDHTSDELPLANKTKVYSRVVAVLSSALYVVGLVGLLGERS